MNETVEGRVEPTGLGQQSSDGWLVAFVDGAKQPLVTIAGKGFSYQGAIRDYAAKFGSRTQAFPYTNRQGSYLFAYEVVGGQKRILVSTSGMRLVPTPGGRGSWKVFPAKPWKVFPAKPTGLGQVFSSYAAFQAAPSWGQTITVTPIPYAVQGTWVRVWSSYDPSSVQQAEPNGAVNLQNDLSLVMSGAYPNNPQRMLQGAQGGVVASDGLCYFGLWDPNTGAAQTPGEPPGVAILRIGLAKSGSGYDIGMCISEGATTSPVVSSSSPVVASGGAAPNVIQIVGPAPAYNGTYNAPPTAMQTGDPPSNGLWWWQYMWVWEGGPPSPTTYPPGAIPDPSSKEIGAWVQVSDNRWNWFPPGNAAGYAPNSSYGLITGGDGIQYAVWANSTQAAEGNPWIGPPGGAANPPPWLTGSVGQWVQTGADYYVWIPTGTTGLSTAEILLLVFGVVVIGGVAYYVWG